MSACTLPEQKKARTNIGYTTKGISFVLFSMQFDPVPRGARRDCRRQSHLRGGRLGEGQRGLRARTQSGLLDSLFRIHFFHLFPLTMQLEVLSFDKEGNVEEKWETRGEMNERRSGRWFAPWRE